MSLFGRDRTRRFDGVTHVVLQEPLNERHKRLLNRHHAVQLDQITPPVPGLDWLVPWASTIERLVVTDFSIIDVSALAHFTGLTHLTLECGVLTGRGNRIAISELSALRDFAGGWYDVLDDLFASASVEALCLGNPPADVFRRAARMPALTSLDLRDARKVREIPGIDRPAGLTTLKIALTTLDTVDGLADYPGLECLELDTVRGVRDLSVLRRLPKLRRLYLEDCGDVVLGARVDELHVVGRTRVRPG